MANLGSHNTMTYLPIRQWYFKPFCWMSKCQSKDIKEQSNYTNFFDIRIRFDKNNNPVFAHGLAEYKFDDRVFEFLNKKKTTKYKTTGKTEHFHPIVMLSLEWDKKEGLNRQKLLFMKFCGLIERKYPRITFCGGAVKYDWKTAYKFTHEIPWYIQYTASTVGNKFSSICPRLFSLFHNHKALNFATDEEYVNVDFIHTI